MAYQSEAALEQQFIEQLNKQEYSTVDIPDYDALVENFKVQFEAFNAPKLDTPITDKEWERILWFLAFRCAADDALVDVKVLLVTVYMGVHQLLQLRDNIHIRMFLLHRHHSNPMS